MTNLVLILIFIIIFSTKIKISVSFFSMHNNPYCVLTCGENEDPNYVCHILNLDIENEKCKIVELTDNIRENIVHKLNEMRTERALSQDEISQGCSNMNLLNYDIELEFLARAEGRFCANSEKITPRCIKTRHMFVDFIHTAIVYSSSSINSRRTYQLQEQYLPTIEYWKNWPYDNATLTRIYNRKQRDQKASLLYWAELDYVGCAMFSSPVRQGSMDLSIDTVCMFGSTTQPPRTPGSPVWQEGYPCTACRQGYSCLSIKYKALCGEDQPLKKAYYKWQNTYSNLWRGT